MSTAPAAMPHSREAERMLLSQCLRQPRLVVQVLDVVTIDDFYDPSHGELMKSLAIFAEEDRPVEQLTIFDEFARIGVPVDRVGGYEGVLRIWDLAPSTANWVHYAESIADYARRRRTIATLDVARARAYDPSADADRAVDDAMGDLSGLISRSRRNDHGSLDDALMELEIEEEDRVAKGTDDALKTGLVAIDRLLAVYPGDLWVHMAHTSHGKTALALEIIAYLVTGQHQVPVALVSLEMKRKRLARRMLAAYTTINGRRQRAGELSPEQQGRWKSGMRHFAGCPLDIHHGSGLTINQVSSWALQVDRRHRAAGNSDGLGLLVIDYIQRLGQADPRQPRQEAVAHMSRGAKDLAHLLECPVLVLAQPNRLAMQLQDKRPQMHHLRESGAIEQDADAVTSGYYHAKTLPEHQRKQWEFYYEFEVHKQRDGDTGRELLHFDRHHTKFRDLSIDEYKHWTTPSTKGE